MKSVSGKFETSKYIDDQIGFKHGTSRARQCAISWKQN